MGILCVFKGALPPCPVACGVLAGALCFIVGCGVGRAGSMCTECAAPGAVIARPSTAAAAQPRPTGNREAAAAALERRLRALRRGGKTRVRYLAAGRVEGAVYGDFVAQSVRAAIAMRQPPPAPRGFALEALSELPGWLLRERTDLRRGAGAVVLRRGAASDLFIEAPHTFFDAGTLQLSVRAFVRLRARALVINTAHRGNVARGLSETARKELARRGELTSDVAHADDSFFTSAHAALARELPRALALQLHGFRDGLVGFDVVVSAAGSRFRADSLARSLRAALPGQRVGVCPRDAAELGGMSNAQARISRGYGAPFGHIELSRSLRERLLRDPVALSRVLDTVARQLRSAEP